MKNALLSAAIFCGLGFPLPAQTDRISSGTEIMVRTTDAIDAKHPADSRIYKASVERDVEDGSGRLVIPKGSDAELVMRDSTDDQIVVDLQSITVNGQRYVVSAPAETVDADGDRKEGIGKNSRTGKYVGGGAIIGSIIGAIAGGGKGAAIGAATGAGAGAATQTITKGGSVKIPSESLLTFRLDRSLRVGSSDSGRRYDNDRSGTRSRQQ